MATIHNDLIIRGLSGQVGRQLAVQRKSDGQYKVCAAHLESHQPLHIDTIDSYHLRLYEAVLYSNAAPQIHDCETRESRQERNGESVSADIIHPPEIHRIDISNYTGHADESIAITAMDDVNVASVGVLIVSDEGILIERGPAILSDKNPYQWLYRTTASAASPLVKIVVDVADVTPLNEG